MIRHGGVSLPGIVVLEGGFVRADITARLVDPRSIAGLGVVNLPSLTGCDTRVSHRIPAPAHKHSAYDEGDNEGFLHKDRYNNLISEMQGGIGQSGY